jgi:hypothetical protein
MHPVTLFPFVPFALCTPSMLALFNNKGEEFVDTGIKILIPVVVEAVLLNKLMLDIHKSFKSFVPKRLDSKINQWVSCFFDHDTKKQSIIAPQSRENLLYLYIRTVMECSTHRNSAGICQDCAKMLT